MIKQIPDNSTDKTPATEEKSKVSQPVPKPAVQPVPIVDPKKPEPKKEEPKKEEPKKEEPKKEEPKKEAPKKEEAKQVVVANTTTVAPAPTHEISTHKVVTDPHLINAYVDTLIDRLLALTTSNSSAQSLQRGKELVAETIAGLSKIYGLDDHQEQKLVEMAAEMNTEQLDLSSLVQGVMGAAFNKLNTRMSDKQAEAANTNMGMPGAAPVSGPQQAAPQMTAPQFNMSPTPAASVQRMVQLDSEDLDSEDDEEEVEEEEVEEEDESEMYNEVAHKAVQMLAQFVPVLDPRERAHIFAQLRAHNPRLFSVVQKLAQSAQGGVVPTPVMHYAIQIMIQHQSLPQEMVQSDLEDEDEEMLMKLGRQLVNHAQA